MPIYLQKPSFRSQKGKKKKKLLMTYIGLRPGITWCLRRDTSLFLNYCHVWVNWVVILFAFWMDPLNCRRRNLGNCFWHSSSVIMRLLYFFFIFFWNVLSFELPILPLSSLYLVKPYILLTPSHWCVQPLNPANLHL